VISSPSTVKEDDARLTAVAWDEGVAICRETPHETLARAFLRFLTERRGVQPNIDDAGIDVDEIDLLADLLGATMVDAQDELLAAWKTMDQEGVKAASSARSWITEAPAWPPASVERMQNRGGENALTMVEDLAGQIAPDPELRLVLLQSWLRPRRLIDKSVLKELAGAAGGQLVREPRFRTWLRAEWTAWARQRYRRVARLALAAGSTSGSKLPETPLP
jgi:hypothetical protein